MEDITVSKVPDVTLIHDGILQVGTLHLTPYHLIFSSEKVEHWVTYPLINSAQCLPRTDNDLYPLTLRCHHFLYFTLTFKDLDMVKEVFNNIQRLTCIDDISKVYAFVYQPQQPFLIDRNQGWNVYDDEKEYLRMGVGLVNSKWRITSVNQNYQFSPTYPKVLCVPNSISDNVLNYARRYRSKYRLPVLSYIHQRNGCSITRASQPLVGIKQNRSAQDERLIQAIFACQPGMDNLIVDARPQANAMANVAIGAGTELMDFYPNCKKVYSGIDNIHVIRDSLSKLMDVINEGDGKSKLDPLSLSRCHWLNHLRTILDATKLIVSHVNDKSSNVLIHCSDGWDRTSQLTSLSMLCLDPYYRTIDGIITLIEKEWLSFGHKFQQRSGHLTKTKAFVNNSDIPIQHDSNPSILINMQNKFYQLSSYKPSFHKETSPIFHQFLDCIYQLWVQYPTQFQFDERLLVLIYQHIYSCTYGTFLFDNEKERFQYQPNIKLNTFSLWSKVLSEKDKFINPIYSSNLHDDVILVPDTKYLKYWSTLFLKKDEDLNYLSSPKPIQSPTLSDNNNNNNNIITNLDHITSKLAKLVDLTLGDNSNNNNNQHKQQHNNDFNNINNNHNDDDDDKELLTISKDQSQSELLNDSKSYLNDAINDTEFYNPTTTSITINNSTSFKKSIKNDDDDNDDDKDELIEISNNQTETELLEPEKKELLDAIQNTTAYDYSNLSHPLEY